MNDMLKSYTAHLPPPLGDVAWSVHPLDGKLLLFERDTGLNVLLEGKETQHLQRVAPRTLLIAVTNDCNRACNFCYRDHTSASLWRYDALLAFCQDADKWGVLEVAFGGGEPLLFAAWAQFIQELYASTRLSISFTTNGTLLTEDFLHAIAGQYGQIRLSLHQDTRWPETIPLLNMCNARFGVNWLITSTELKTIESTFDRLFELGVRDFLLLSYKGNTLPTFHLREADYRVLAEFVNRVYTKLGTSVQIKLDVCWGNRLLEVPRLFVQDDCSAGDAFLSITSDRTVKPCSFASEGVPFDTIDDVKAYWQEQRHMQQPAPVAGCARLREQCTQCVSQK